MAPKLFSELGLSQELLKAIDKLGFEQAAPIQAEAIPALLAGRDVVGQSQTGSGKTAAFAIPAIEKVDAADRAVQVLILCPTRELAVQVAEEVHKLALFKRGFHALPVYGGQSYDRQFVGLRQGAQVVIGTPGRVMDHMRRGTLNLKALKMVILDEVDVMLNMGFRDDIELILQGTPAARQTVFFSATIPPPIRRLIEAYARQPQNIRIEQKALTVPTVEQVYYEVDRRYKVELLTRLIDLHDLKLGIIFCNTKRMVDELAEHLNAQGYSADRLHGDMTQAMRDRVMQKFRKSALEFLVATDVAARGIDVDDVEVVFNYDLPYDGEDYVHRIGRTGRQGRKGWAVSFASGRELFQIRTIERYTNTRIARGKIPTVREVEEARAHVAVQTLRTTLQKGEFQRQDPLIESLLEEGFSSTDIASALLHLWQSGGQGGAAPAPTPPVVKAKQSFETPHVVRADSTRSAETFPRRSSPPAPPRDRGSDRVALAPQEETTLPADQENGGAPNVGVPPRETKQREVAPMPKGVLPSKARKTTPPGRGETPESSAPRPKAAERSRRPEPWYAAKAPFRGEAPEAPAPIAEWTRLWISVGEQMGVVPGDLVGAILGETGLRSDAVGKVDLRDRHAFVDVASQHAAGIIAKLNRTRIKGNRVKVKVA